VLPALYLSRPESVRISTATVMPGFNGIVALSIFIAVSSRHGNREDEAFRFEDVAFVIAEHGCRHGVQRQDVIGAVGDSHVRLG
jgi:hypothetical protein